MQSYLDIRVEGEGQDPSLRFGVRECILPAVRCLAAHSLLQLLCNAQPFIPTADAQVPLNVRSEVLIDIFNEGFDNLELQVSCEFSGWWSDLIIGKRCSQGRLIVQLSNDRQGNHGYEAVLTHAKWHGNDPGRIAGVQAQLPADASHCPVEVSFPEGNLIGTASYQLPLLVTFISDVPLSFSTSIAIEGSDGSRFPLAVSATADNSLLTLQTFLEVCLTPAMLLRPASSPSCL